MNYTANELLNVYGSLHQISQQTISTVNDSLEYC